MTLKFVSVCFVGVGFITTNILLRYEYVMENITLFHLNILLNITIIFIILPRYMISQNKNCQLYVRVYHHQPPPVLPWQLPNSFDPYSVKLTIVQHENE